MAPSRIFCNRCGPVVNFASKARLLSHQRSKHCQPRLHGKTIHLSKQPKATGEEGHTTVQDENASMHLSVPRNDDVVGPAECSDSMDSMGSQGEHPQEHIVRRSRRLFYDFYPTFQLVPRNFIQSCNDGEGLSKEDTQTLLDFLADPPFDSKKLTVKNAQDVARYIAKEMPHP